MPLKNLKILDIGCGGGLVCEPMSRLGANVTGIDASLKNIKIAESHSKKNHLKIKYLNTLFTSSSVLYTNSLLSIFFITTLSKMGLTFIV